MESSSVCKHASDRQNRTTAKRESDFLITSMITCRIGRHEVLLRISQNFEKIQERNQTSAIRNVSKKKRTTARAHDAYSPFIQAWRVITLSDYKHDAFTVLLIIVMRPSAVQLGMQTYEWLRKLDDREAGVRFVNYECDYGSNWTTRSPVIN